MIHLRIVAPGDRAEPALRLLERIPTVCNVIHLERAAVSPRGDVILCDVARTDASVLIADLRELEIDTLGSIAIEEIDSEVSAAATAAERAAAGGSDPVVWEEVTSRTSENVELTHSFLLFMALAMLIAAVGIYFDQPVLIIGAMVVGPDFGPIAGFCVAVVARRGELARRSAAALAIGFPLGVVATYLATLVLKETGELPAAIDFDAHTLTRFISNPDLFSAYVAVIAGVVGMLSLTSAKSSALVGVLISVATIPAASNVGVAAAYGEWGTAADAGLQLLINLGSIFVGGLITLFVQRRLYVRRRRRHLSESARADAGLPLGTSARRPAQR